MGRGCTCIEWAINPGIHCIYGHPWNVHGWMSLDIHVQGGKVIGNTLYLWTSMERTWMDVTGYTEWKSITVCQGVHFGFSVKPMGILWRRWTRI